MAFLRIVRFSPHFFPSVVSLPKKSYVSHACLGRPAKSTMRNVLQHQGTGAQRWLGEQGMALCKVQDESGEHFVG